MQLSRRNLLKSAAIAGAGSLPWPNATAEAQPAMDAGVQFLTSTSGVTLPPKGHAFLKFSFDFPEPSIEVAGHLISARVYTFENTYAMDPKQIRVERHADGLRLVCDGLTWAGGQETAPGRVELNVHNGHEGLSIQASAHTPGKRIKSVTVIVRWIPRGQISRAGGRFFDPKEDEFQASWSEFNAGLVSPIVVIRSGESFSSIALAARKDEVRTARFYLQPGPEGYRAELTYEREAWTEGESVDTPPWILRKGASYDDVARPHYAHVEQAFGLPDWNTREDVPSWMHDISLVVALHGAHWTGYIFNTYAAQLKILKWVAEQIDPRRVMVFLPAWDGRYYWNYPVYQPDPRMGGAEGLRALVDGAHKLGFHLVAMFGSNVANMDAPGYDKVKDALTIRTDGDPWRLDYVDWDNDRRGEANYGFMNLAVPSWRQHLEERIAATLQAFQLDGYFLDIVGVSENTRQGDMNLGTRQLVADLRKRLPGKLAVGEMHYDALLDSIAVYQADVTQEYPQAFYKYGRMFQHLSFPAPGRGSTGVHEYGFSGRDTVPTPNQWVIPTLTVVDDTFSKHRDGMLAIINAAKQWRFPG